MLVAMESFEVPVITDKPKRMARILQSVGGLDVVGPDERAYADRAIVVIAAPDAATAEARVREVVPPPYEVGPAETLK
jgi:hypothetical protein